MFAPVSAARLQVFTWLVFLKRSPGEGLPERGRRGDVKRGPGLVS